MTSSRSKDVLLPIIGKARAEEFSQLRLPTRMEVLQRYIYFFKIAKTTKSRAANSTSHEVINLWKKVADGSTSNCTCYKTLKSVKSKLQNMWNQYDRIRLSLRPNRKHSNKAIAQEQDFRDKLHILFDISKPDAKEHLKDEDFLFLSDQRGTRKFTFGKKDMELERRQSRKRYTEEAFDRRKRKCDEEKERALEAIDSVNISDSDVTSSLFESEEEIPETSASSQNAFITLNVPRRFTSLPQVVAAADRHKLSSNALNGVLTGLIKDSGGDVNDFIISASTTRGARQTARSNEFEHIKNKFLSDLRDCFFSIHWDEKLLKQGDDYEPKEHIAILSSHGNDIILLGTTRLESGTGLNQANAIKNMLDESDIQELCLGMCFDTTASNTGKFSGAYILLEAILSYPLLWTACRHHELEIILSNVAKLVFGPSVGPKIDCFIALSQKWPALDLQRETSHMNVGKNILEEHVTAARSCLINILSDETFYCPRDDYKELLQLSLYYIDKTTFSKFTFRRPGPHHRCHL